MSSWEIQALIDEKQEEIAASRAELASLENELVGVRQEILALKAQLEISTRDTVAEKTSVQALIGSSQSNRTEILGPEWSRDGAEDTSAAFNEAIRFAYSQLARLESALYQSETIETPLGNRHLPYADLSFPSHSESSTLFSAEAEFASPEGISFEQATLSATPSTGVNQGYSSGVTSLLSYANGDFRTFETTEIREASVVLDTTYDYEVGDKSGSIPYKVYNFTVRDPRNEESSAERFGIEVASAMMVSEGRRVIVALGGPGKPDILSLDAGGRIWITEVKGSLKGTPLYRSGLLRDVRSLPNLPQGEEDPLAGREKVWENSPEWLRRSGADVLRALKQIEMKTDDFTVKSHVRELGMRYAEAVAEGFDKKSYTTEIFQVALLNSDQGAPYLDPNPTIHAYCAEVEPARITQVDVEYGESTTNT